MYFAQHGEDRWLEENWKRLGLPERGTFVEVGVGNGVVNSNSLWLENRGWTGLLIEADPRWYWSIRTNRRGTLVPCAVAKTSRPFYLAENANLSGFLRTEGQPIPVATEKLSTVLEVFQIWEVDVLSIDTEGTEVEVSETFDLGRWYTRVVIAEWNTKALSNDRDAIAASVTASGRLRVEWGLGRNLAFVRDELSDWST